MNEVKKDRKLVLIGGVHGVGKTTVINEIKKLQPEFGFFDPGDLFWRYHINDPIIAPAGIEKMTYEALNNTVCPVTLVNYHYAVWTPDGYIPHLGWETFGRLSLAMRDGSIVPVLLWAKPQTILERRVKDREAGVKKRKLCLDCIETEMLNERQFFEKHKEILWKHNEGKEREHPAIISNDQSPEKTAKEILETLKI